MRHFFGAFDCPMFFPMKTATIRQLVEFDFPKFFSHVFPHENCCYPPIRPKLSQECRVKFFSLCEILEIVLQDGELWRVGWWNLFVPNVETWGKHGKTIIWWIVYKILQLLGGFKHELYFPFHIWDVILPIDELIFSRWLKHVETTNQLTVNG